MIRFEDILDKVESYIPNFDEALLQKAYSFSAREHRGQTRSSGEPYLIHPLNVAYILADMRLDETSIAVGLLHMLDAAGELDGCVGDVPVELEAGPASGDLGGAEGDDPASTTSEAASDPDSDMSDSRWFNRYEL